MNKVAIVSPVHIQPSSKWVQALVGIQKRGEADVILVDDSNGKLDLPLIFNTYDYALQKEVMGDELYQLFEQFHKSSACKQFGLWRAHQLGYEFVIVIDSDCIVPDDFVERHLEALEMNGNVGWVNPLFGTGFYSRGYPYSKRGTEKWVNMGLWTNQAPRMGLR